VAVLGALAASTSAGCAASAAPTPAASPSAAPTERDTPLTGDIKDDAELARVIREHYTKYEREIPMRDGVTLHTELFVPKVAGRDPAHVRHFPILLTRTPYSVAPYGVDNVVDGNNTRMLRRFAPSPGLVASGYIFVHQDVRGRLMSGGTFVDVRPPATTGTGIDEATDAYDTIDWLVKNVPENNGKVGLWGISYPGFYAAQAAINAHPALAAVSPQAPVTEWFLGDDFHHNGAFFYADSFDFYVNFGRPRPEPTTKSKWEFEHSQADVYDYFLALGTPEQAGKKYLANVPFWNDLLDHGTYDAFWRARDPRPRYVQNTGKTGKPAVLTVGGWFDAEDLYGALATYRAFEAGALAPHNSLVMGPWRHGGWARNDGDRLGAISFGQKTSAFYQHMIEAPFFERALKGRAAASGKEVEAWIFETGTNEWRQYDHWPPKGAREEVLYFRENGGLSSAPPAMPAGPEGRDSYVSDPSKPVPYRAALSERIDEEYMSDDQRFAARRPDVLLYQSPALTTEVTLDGPIEALLKVAVTGTDADFIVKLIDVYPENAADPEPNPLRVRMGGFQQLVRAEVMRGKFRSSGRPHGLLGTNTKEPEDISGLMQPKPFVPGEETLVRFALPDVAHTFRTGHRIAVQVQSTWFPLIDRNPQTFCDIYRAKPSDYKVATHTLLRNAQTPSFLRVTVGAGALPR